MENGAKKKIQQESMCASLPRYFFAPIRASNRFAGPFICNAKIETQLIHELLDKSSITRFQNKLKRFFTHVSFPVKRVESTKTCHV